MTLSLPGKSTHPAPYRPMVSVVICTRDRLPLLGLCIDAVRRQRYPALEILVVDNSPGGSACDLCIERGVRRIHVPVPGLTRARNIGAMHAQGDLVAYIDDDAIVEERWLDALVAAFADPATDAVTGRVRYMHAVEDTREMSAVEAEGERPRARGTFDRATSGWFALACFGGVGDGGNMAFRRELFTQGLAFDERIGRGRLLDSGDEHVVFAALIGRGHRIVHVPEAVVRHPSPPTPALQVARRYGDLRASISHLLFVWFQFPVHRAEVLRFLARAVARRILPAPSAQPSRRAAGLSRRQAVAAVFGGLRLYWRARREWPDGARAQPPAFVESTAPSR